MRNEESRLLHPTEPANDHLVRDFRAYAFQIADIGAKCGIEITAFDDPKLLYFSALHAAQRIEIISQLKLFVDICESAIRNGDDPKDSLKLLWWAVKRMGLRPAGDVFSRIETDDVLEINNGVFQLFRNFNYFRYCSYTLEDLYCRPWTDLWERDEAMTSELISLIQAVIGSGKPAWDGPKGHSVRERASRGKILLNYNMNFMAPLYEQGKNSVSAVLVSIKPEFLGKPARIPQAAAEERDLEAAHAATLSNPQ